MTSREAARGSWDHSTPLGARWFAAKPLLLAVVSLLAALSSVPACTGPRRTVRVVGGQALMQRAVPEEAYAEYVRAAELEQRSELERAATAYRRALASDPGSVEIQTRIAAVECRRGTASADDWFEAARRRDPGYEPLWRELAICSLSRGQLELARRAAERAVRLDPDCGPASVVLARVLALAGRREEARRWLVAVLAGEATGAAVAEARQELMRLAGGDALPFSGPDGTAAPARRAQISEVDRAVLTHDIVRARSLAAVAGLPPAALAVRAAALGRVELAKQQAELVLSAQPDSGSAWVAALVAADLGRDLGALERAALLLGERPEAPTSLASLLLAEVLERQVGEDARVAWLRANGSTPAADEPLEREVERRLRP